MATLRNKKNSAAVLRETPENTRNSQSQNTLKNTSHKFMKRSKGEWLKNSQKKFSRTESLILGALSKLDEFLLNPQARTYSAAVPGISGNGDLGNREPNGDRSSNDPCPEAMVSSHHSSTLNSSELQEYSHSSRIKASYLVFLDRK